MAEKQLDDRLRIMDLKWRYCKHLDSNETEKLFDLFTDDAELWSVGMRGTFKGNEELREWCVDATRDHFQSIHMGLCPTIDVSGDSATGHWYSLVFIIEDDEVEMGQGEYEEEYRRIDGTWYISSRRTERNLTVNLGQNGKPELGLR